MKKLRKLSNKRKSIFTELKYLNKVDYNTSNFF